MNRGTGILFCLLGGFLFAARYLTAAVYMSAVGSWIEELFSRGLSYQGKGLFIRGLLSAAVGIFYLLWARYGPAQPSGLFGVDFTPAFHIAFDTDPE